MIVGGMTDAAAAAELHLSPRTVAAESSPSWPNGRARRSPAPPGDGAGRDASARRDAGQQEIRGFHSKNMPLGFGRQTQACSS